MRARLPAGFTSTASARRNFRGSLPARAGAAAGPATTAASDAAAPAAGAALLPLLPLPPAGSVPPRRWSLYACYRGRLAGSAAGSAAAAQVWVACASTRLHQIIATLEPASRSCPILARLCV